MSESQPGEKSDDLEERRFALEAELRRGELGEKTRQREADERKAEREYQLRSQEIEGSVGKGLRFTSAQATVAAAILALLSAMGGGLIQGWFSRDVEAGKNAALIAVEKIKVEGELSLESEKQEASALLAKQQFETTLILQAVAAPEPETRKKNLDFFVDAGFISDPGDKIKNMTVDQVPAIASPVLNFGNLDNFQDCSTPTGSEYSQFSSELLAFLCKWEGGLPPASMLTALQNEIDDRVTAPLNEHQMNALISLAMNIGISAFERSSVLQAVNSGDTAGLADTFLVFNKAAGRELSALTRRRQAEAELFGKTDSAPTPASARPADMPAPSP